MLLLTLLLALLAADHSVLSGWDNQWDKRLTRNCPAGSAVSVIASYHNNGREDRRWWIRCYNRHIPSPGRCYWTQYVNRFDEVINFRCPHSDVISGMHSYHSNYAEDRRWKFKCCLSKGHVTFDCKLTPWVNYWDEYFHWEVPGANFLVGVASYHDNGREDRRWRYTYCRLRRY